jgi:hypothetical protein
LKRSHHAGDDEGEVQTKSLTRWKKSAKSRAFRLRARASKLQETLTAECNAFREADDPQQRILPYQPLVGLIVDLPVKGSETQIIMPQNYEPSTQSMMEELMRQLVLINRADGLIKQVGKAETAVS